MSAEELRADLESRGYVEKPEHGDLRAGDRVHHAGQQYTEAYLYGTATILAIFEKLDSAWSRSWRMPDVELIIQRDDGDVTQWAQYHAWKVVTA